MGVCFQFRHTLLDLVKALEGFLAFVFDVRVQYLQLNSNVLDRAGESYDSLS